MKVKIQFNFVYKEIKYFDVSKSFQNNLLRVCLSDGHGF